MNDNLMPLVFETGLESLGAIDAPHEGLAKDVREPRGRSVFLYNVQAAAGAPGAQVAPVGEDGLEVGLGLCPGSP